MKKLILRIYKWIIISVTLQILLLMFVDTYMFGSGSEITTSDDPVVEEPKVPDGSKVNIGEKASNIKISYEKRFASYILDGKLMVMDIAKKSNIKEIFETGKDVTYYRWMNDRNILIYATKTNIGTSSELEITTIDVDNDKIRVLPKITKQPFNSQINSIEFSHLTNMIYAKAVTGKVERIYSFDIMNQMEYVTETTLGAVMRETNLTDHLFMDNGIGKIKIWSGSRRSINTLDVKEKSVLLGITEKDEVILGVLDKDNLIEAIKVGKMEQNTIKTWKTIEMENHGDAEYFIITNEGKIFYNDIKISTLFEVGSILNKQYNGKLVDVKGDSIITQQDEKLIISNLQ
jgi:hypothetical protein